jgi:small subunit ribosomal protein S1
MKNPKASNIKADYLDEFNTDENTGGEEIDASATKKNDFASLLANSFKSQDKKLRVGDKIRGKILIVGSVDVYVSTGTQKDGVIQRRDLLDAEGNCPYQAGDEIELYVTMVKGDDVRLSKNASDRNMAEDLSTAFANNQPIQGRIVEVCNGGVRVSIKGKIAFCPISQIDTKHIETADEYVGRSFDFKITAITEGGKNIVVSRRKLLDAEREVNSAHFLSETKDGDIAQGRVTRMEPYGAFVELAPGLDGLVHISEIAWSRLGDPSEVLTLGQDVTVKLLKREVLNGKAKISLSIKQATARPEREIEAPSGDKPGRAPVEPKSDPWQKLTIGQVFTGTVNRKEVYGLFVQLEPGITGLLHKSRVSDTAGFHFEKVRVGDPLPVQILEIRLGERQISLGIPGDGSDEDWRTYQAPVATTSFGSLGDRMGAALLKKKA